MRRRPFARSLSPTTADLSSQRVRFVNVIVNGQPHRFRRDGRVLVHELVRHALEVTDARGAIWEWELRDRTGRLIERDQPVGRAGILPDETLYLSPAVGVGA